MLDFDFLLTQLNALHLLRPIWLLALIPVFIIYGLLRLNQQRQNQSGALINDVLYAFLTQGGEAKQTSTRLWPLLLAALLCVIAMAGPTTQKIPKPVYDVAQAKVLLLDMSLSMRATDITPDRLSRMRFKAMDLINNNNGGEIGLVAYAGDAFVISPITTDGGNLNALIPGLTPEIMPEFGSDPTLGLQRSAEMLEQAGYINGDIIWFTDGIDYDQIPALNNLLARINHRVSIIAVGTADGAPIKLPNGQLLKESNGAIVIPKLDSRELARLSEKTQGGFSQMTADDTDINYILSVADSRLADATQREMLQGDDWYELGPYLLLPVLLILLVYARSHWVMLLACWLCLPISQIATSPGALAQATLVSSPVQSDQAAQSGQAVPTREALNAVDDPLDFLPKALHNNNQQALSAFKQGDFASAEALFSDPSWQAHAQYALGDYDNALAQFKASPNDAIQQFNAANTLVKQTQYDAALKAYSNALALQPDFVEALENKAALEAFLKEQSSQQDPSEQQGSNEQSENQSGEDAGEESQQQSQQGEEQGEKNSDQQSEQDQKQNSGSNDESQQSQPTPTDELNESEQPSETEESDNSQQEQEQTEQEQAETNPAQAQPSGVSDKPLTPEEQEKLQRMQALMNKVPNDPGFLLKRKMELEYQKRKRQSAPPARTKQW